MSDELRDQIYNNMNLKDTDELLEIWLTNDRVEWSDATFEVIKELLVERDVEIPDDENYSFSDVELKIIDNENPPDFYDPFEVLQLVKWIDWATKAVVVIVILYNLVSFSTFTNMFGAYSPEYQNSFVIYLLAFIVMTINIVITIAITNFLLKTLSQILKILMEMEFNSRKVKQ